MYDDYGIGNAGKQNTAAEDVEWRPSEIRNYGEKGRSDDRGDEDGGGKDAGTEGTLASEARLK